VSEPPANRPLVDAGLLDHVVRRTQLDRQAVASALGARGLYRGAPDDVALAEHVVRESGLEAHEVVELLVAEAELRGGGGDALRVALARWMSGHGGRRIAPIDCPSCGAPVPLAPNEQVSCRYCGAAVRLPLAHVKLHREKQSARENRRATDAIWRAMPEPMPWWAPKLVVAILCGSTAVLVTVIMFMWASGRYGWSVRQAMVLGIFLPIFVLLYGLIEMLAYFAPYERLCSALSAERDERFPDTALCRNCGAALTVEMGDVAATCSYCGVESLLGRIRSVTRRRVAREATHAKGDLKQAADAANMLRLQRKIVRIIVPPILIGCLALFWALFPGYVPPEKPEGPAPATRPRPSPRR
jgi:DNA-directed RNA polymerase subunit RPC12/RpoP